MMTVLNEIAPINYVSQTEERSLGNLEVQALEGRFVLFDRANPGLR